MEPGCLTVQRTNTDGTEFVVGIWNEGRIGTFRGMRSGKPGYGAIVFGEKGNGDAGGYDGYKPLVEEICKFFQTKRTPFDVRETIEIFAFMEAADVSKQLNGLPVSIAETIEKAKKAVLIPVKLQVSPEGSLTMNSEKIELGKLSAALDSLTAGKPNGHVRVILRAEKGTPHEIVLSVCNNLGKAVLADYLYER
jgi:biopolymer transport protein ExbD